MFWLITFSFGMIAWLILVVRAPLDPNLQIGKPSPITMQASHDARYYSATRTEEARARAESDPSTVIYTRDTAVPTQQRNLLSELLTTITQIRDDPTLSANDRRVRLTALPNSTLVITTTMANTIVTISEDEWKSARQLGTDLYDMAMREYNFSLTDQDVKNLRERSLPYWAAERADGATRDLVISLTTPFLKANQLVDEDATRKRKQDAREAIQPVDVQLLQGESIVRAGDLITPDVLEKLEALGELEGELNIMRVLGRGIFAWLAACVLGSYLALTRPHVRRSRRYTLVIYSLTLITLALARMVIGLPLGETWPYAFPLGAAVLLIAALFDSGIALVVAIVLSFLIAFIDSSSFGLNVALLLSSAAGVFALGRANRSLRFLIAGLVLATVIALVQIAQWTTNASQLSPQQMPMILVMSLVNGTLASILALGLYNLLGQLAGVVTPFQLMELSNPTQPLLRKLIREAPGTYYHSVTVGNLAESAAELIGADALLLRVAAYYHDVGKSARPYFYTDNQNDRENVHNELDPRTSAQIIADHVREGVNMARAAHLPIQIIEFIQTHHGTSIIQHFYQMALREQDTVDVADFRYPGPKPQTREHAILMLADSVEATVRSKSQHGKLVTPRQRASGQGQPGAQTLEEMVSFIIDERIRSGQLDESPLTLHELACIRQAFITTLQGIYHPRVEYAPQLVKTT